MQRAVRHGSVAVLTHSSQRAHRGRVLLAPVPLPLSAPAAARSQTWSGGFCGGSGSSSRRRSRRARCQCAREGWRVARGGGDLILDGESRLRAGGRLLMFFYTVTFSHHLCHNVTKPTSPIGSRGYVWAGCSLLLTNPSRLGTRLAVMHRLQVRRFPLPAEI
jgi:hypothetical protein